MHSMKDDTLWGIRWGLSIASRYSAYVIVLAVAQRSIQVEAYGANIFELLLVYFVGGSLGGAIIGVLRPYNSTGIGGALIGALGAFHSGPVR
jgi:hypothetical protein